MSDEIEELRTRVAELERRVAVLFQQTGAADWQADAAKAPPVSDEVRLLLERGETRKAASSTCSRPAPGSARRPPPRRADQEISAENPERRRGG